MTQNFETHEQAHSPDSRKDGFIHTAEINVRWRRGIDIEQPLSRKAYNTLMKHIEKKIDLHGATPHVLRHTYLTTAAGENIDPKTLQSMAGHAKHDMTMNTYVHPKKENVARAGQMMDALLGSYTKAV